ncbi:recombinase RecT [Photobacterium damselae]|uniref:Recombinase RecT n=2 Tax=Photobacterium damselae subsp. damselae TaxID=85581 RepID=A0AAD3ZUM1_PHODD|nr:recombinase RecT [Photobacterium damselae]KAB1179935.1 recombinase RecT [Photobacterium damselae subsp. damselae]MCG3823470.1 recombinase RecT [Photobacterium damselae]PSB91425.1 hypothetical protein C5F64_00525 [Photobacterium damselae subsp. damselae]
MSPFARIVKYERVKTPLWSSSNAKTKQSDIERQKATKYSGKDCKITPKQQPNLQQTQSQKPASQTQPESNRTRQKQYQHGRKTPATLEHKAQVLKPHLEAIEQAKEVFVRYNSQFAGLKGSELSFAEEALHARNIIQDSYNNTSTEKFALTSATIESVQRALYMAASVGLSLNPIKKHAYLVPRFNRNSGQLECHLEPSYRGLEFIAFRAGLLKKVHCVLVHAKDKFEWINESERPIHTYNPFAPDNERGLFVGGYCIADFTDGTRHVSFTTDKTIIQCQGVSQYDAIWNTWKDKMREKTIIRQAFNEWPIFDATLTRLSSYLVDCDRAAA